jgi:hypothetical protein
VEAKEHLTTAPRQRVTLMIVYHDALGQEPDETYTGPVYERVEGDDQWRMMAQTQHFNHEPQTAWNTLLINAL